MDFSFPRLLGPPLMGYNLSGALPQRHLSFFPEKFLSWEEESFLIHRPALGCTVRGISHLPFGRFLPKTSVFSPDSIHERLKCLTWFSPSFPKIFPFKGGLLFTARFFSLGPADCGYLLSEGSVQVFPLLPLNHSPFLGVVHRRFPSFQ